MRSVEIKYSISSCLRCPFLVKGPFESTDGFDRGQNWYCGKSDNKKIVGFVEWHEEKKIEIPQWCVFVVNEE